MKKKFLNSQPLFRTKSEITQEYEHYANRTCIQLLYECQFRGARHRGAFQLAVCNDTVRAVYLGSMLMFIFER